MDTKVLEILMEWQKQDAPNRKWDISSSAQGLLVCITQMVSSSCWMYPSISMTITEADIRLSRSDYPAEVVQTMIEQLFRTSFLASASRRNT
jgi:hypothetical protein